MSWEDFFGRASSRRSGASGYEVKRLKNAAADLELTQVGPGDAGGLQALEGQCAPASSALLRELDAARQALEAGTCIYVAAGDITDTARALRHAGQHPAAARRAELAALLPVLPGGKTK